MVVVTSFAVAGGTDDAPPRHSAPAETQRASFSDMCRSVASMRSTFITSIFILLTPSLPRGDTGKNGLASDVMREYALLRRRPVVDRCAGAQCARLLCPAGDEVLDTAEQPLQPELERLLVTGGKCVLIQAAQCGVCPGAHRLL